MAYANLTCRVTKEDKNSFERFCDNTGLNVSSALNLFVKTVIRENKIPFEIEADPFYSESNIRRLEESIAQFKAGKVVEKTIEELEAMANE